MKFFDFTFHEMAIYDLPAMINLIINTTKVPKITYFGHSQGTLQVFIGMTLLPEYFKQTLNGVNALDPVTSLSNIGNSILSLAAKTRLDDFIRMVNLYELLPTKNFVNDMMSILCDKLHILCSGILEVIADSNAHSMMIQKRCLFS